MLAVALVCLLVVSCALSIDLHLHSLSGLYNPVLHMTGFANEKPPGWDDYKPGEMVGDGVVGDVHVM